MKKKEFIKKQITGYTENDEKFTITIEGNSRLLQFNQSKSARNVNFIMFLALFTCFYIVYMDVYML